ncbi:hypothetical protein ACO2Q3_00125 [Caulobacter sp. KR2-114]|uniref:hypothetical protein n=1 Tax=Caulobacter sp. KR2-114 TaxID=3400912 RepID=UPI003C02B08F
MGLLGASPPAPAPTVSIDPTPIGPAFRTDQAFGAGIDGMTRGGVDELFTAHNIAWMRKAGLKPVTYRLRTELAIEAWHWGNEGAWSDPAHAQGYWTSSDDPKAPILITWGYRLPRRGDTVDQANNDGYSRLDDGDPSTFWKSSPYLDRHYTGEAKEGPQWVVLSLDAAAPIDTARIAWAAPYARRFEVQYWTGVDEYDPDGDWVTFPHGRVDDGQGGAGLLRLADRPVHARYLRLLLSESSRTAPPGAADPRDAMGYAIGELGFGVTGADGTFHDVVRHGAGPTLQTLATVSSTDPWHRAVDRDVGLEQPGFDRLFASGITNGLPVMIPVGALYDTPENAAAELRFLKRRGYPFTQVELGEEPDGQNIAAEDFARLYAQFADVVHAVDPALKTGGPSLQDGISDVWLAPGADRSWTHRFIAALRARGRLSDLGFFTFERYPYDQLCGDIGARLRRQTRGLADTFARLKADGVPADIPWIVSEYGFSAFGGAAEDDLPGALVNAEIAAETLSLGGQGAFLFGYNPNRPWQHGEACVGNGELMILEADEDGQATWALPAFQGARMLSQDWAGPGGRLLPAHSPVLAADGTLAVAAYALRRPDGSVAVLLLNRGPATEHPVRLAFAGAPPGGAVQVVQYGPGQYRWRADGVRGHPSRDQPPVRFVLPSGRDILRLPAYSLTVAVFTPR